MSFNVKSISVVPSTPQIGQTAERWGIRGPWNGPKTRAEVALQSLANYNVEDQGSPEGRGGTRGPRTGNDESISRLQSYFDRKRV